MVIAIISLLVALLVPTLGQIMQQTLASQCKANLLCQGMALQAYVNQHSAYPGHVDDDGASNGRVAIWPPRIRKYAESIDIFGCPANEWGYKWQKRFGTGAGYATQAQADKWGYELGEKMLNVQTVPFSYGYNDWGRWDTSIPQRGLGGDMWTVSQVHVNEVVNPGQMIAIGDNTCNSSWDYNIDPTDSLEYPGKVHFDGANILFCGGEVKWYTQAELVNVSPSGNAGTSQQEAMTRLWNSHNLWSQ